MAKEVAKYWENEEPQVDNLGVNRFSLYQKAGKLQIFRTKEGTRFGVTKGVTIDLAEMDEDELRDLGRIITEAVRHELDTRGEDVEEEAKPKKKKKGLSLKKKKGA